MNSTLFRRWRRWLDRVLNEQLSVLLTNQHIFQQLGECTAPYVGTHKSTDLAKWMEQGYIAIAATTVRRMLEEPAKPPKPVLCPHCSKTIVKPKPEDSVSLVVLLRDIEQHASLFTRERFRKGYSDVSLADRDFNKITRSKGARVLSASRVRRDIDALHRVARPIRRLVNKAVAHTARDRRKVGKPKFKQLSNAIEALAEASRVYSLLVRGTYPCPRVPADDCHVVSDFRKIWPPLEPGGSPYGVPQGDDG